MAIQHMTYPDIDPAYEGQHCIINVDADTLIFVEHFGTGLYSVRIWEKTPSGANSIFHEQFGIPNESCTWPNVFGVGATWWEPLTFAHAVMDIINNQ